MVGEQAHEHVDPAGGAFRIGAGAHERRHPHPLRQLGDIDAAPLQHRATGQVQLMHGHVRQPVADLAPRPRQEGGAHPPAALAQAQVQAGRLDLALRERLVGGNRAARDQGLDGLAGQDAGVLKFAHRGRHSPCGASLASAMRARP